MGQDVTVTQGIQLKKVGLVGGIGPALTLDYYKGLLKPSWSI